MTEHELPQTTNMRVRLKAFVVCVVFSVTVYFILGLLSNAQLHMKSNVESFEAPVVRYQNGWYGGQTLIEELGFVQNPRLFPQAYHDDENLPVVITAADTDTYPDLMLFLKSFRLYFPEKRLVVYNLGFGSAERDSVRDKITVICRCQIRTVRWERFPEHCRKRHLKVYKPILVQEALVEFGAVFWCDPLTTFSSAELFLLVSQAKRVGVVSWPLVYPTSALTHPDMFQYFNTSAEKYHFHRMVDTSHFIMYNFESVHKQLMLPWVKCALDKHCIDPVGAKSTGCLFDQKPKYKYLGCHKYEMSAFNILLGPMFKFEMPYVALLDIFMMRKPQRNTWWSKWNFTIFNWFS